MKSIQPRCRLSTRSLRQEANKVLVGLEEPFELLVVALFTGGHVLLEGVPGTAKTLMAKTLAHLLQAQFTRVQFTPDLMPSDILGTSVFDLATNTFHLQKGPIFTQILLADEINRAPAKTQSALLEAMEERQVNLDGQRYLLEPPFMVIATQNPIEYEGTYPLPEAQLDRFMFKVLVPYSRWRSKMEVLRRYHQGFDPHNLASTGLKALPASQCDQPDPQGDCGYRGGRRRPGLYRPHHGSQPPIAGPDLGRQHPRLNPCAAGSQDLRSAAGARLRHPG